MRSHRILAAMATLATIGLTASALSACGTSAPDAVDRDLANSDDPAVIKIGTTDSHQQAWSVFQDLAAQQGITLTIVHFSSYGEINDSLAQGGLDVNKFQHIMHLAEYNKKAGQRLGIVGSGEVFPLSLFWKDHASLNGIEGEKIRIPNDPANLGRALNMLAQAGLITLQDGVGNTPVATLADIDTAASKVAVTAIDAAQTLSAYDEGYPAVINNNWLERAGIEPSLAVFEDDPLADSAEPYINVFAAREADIADKTLNQLVDIWHDPAVTAALEHDSKGTAVQVRRSQAELNTVLDTLESLSAEPRKHTSP